MPERQVVDLSVAVKGVNSVVQQMSRLNQSMFKYRDNVAQSGNAMTRAGNASASLFRRLARLRTGVFILATFFAVRPIIRFIKSLKDVSPAMDEVLFKVKEVTDRFRFAFGEAFAPVFEEVGKRVLSVVNDLVENFKKFGDKSTIQGIATGLLFIKDIVFGIANFFNAMLFTARAMVPIAKIIGLEFQKGFAKAAMGAADLLNTLNLMNESEFFGDLAKKLGGGTKAISEINEEIKILSAEVSAFQGPMEEALDGVVSRFKALFVETSANREMLQKIIQAFDDLLSPNRLEGFGTFGQGINNVLKSLARRTGQDIGETFGNAIASALETRIGDAFFNTMKGRFKDLRDVVTGFLEDIQRALSKLASQQLITGLAGGIQRFLTPTTQNVIGPPIPSSFPATSPRFGDPSSFIGPPIPPPPAIRSGLSPIGIHPPSASRADEGLVSGTTNVTAGERGMEAFVNLRGGKIPVQLNGAGGGGGPTIIIAPQVIDGPSFGAWLQKEKKTIHKLVAAGINGESAALRDSMRSGFTFKK